jgi:hypothetical protein
MRITNSKHMEGGEWRARRLPIRVRARGLVASSRSRARRRPKMLGGRGLFPMRHAVRSLQYPEYWFIMRQNYAPHRKIVAVI